MASWKPVAFIGIYRLGVERINEITGARRNFHFTTRQNSPRSHLGTGWGGPFFGFWKAWMRGWEGGGGLGNGKALGWLEVWGRKWPLDSGCGREANKQGFLLRKDLRRLLMVGLGGQEL